MESNGTDLECFGTVMYYLESFGTVSWKVMEPIWKVLVLGVRISIETDLKSFGTVIYYLESFGTASWNVMEPIWKVLVPCYTTWKVLVLRSFGSNCASVSRDLGSIGTIIWRGQATSLY